MKPEDLEPYERFQMERYNNVLPPLNIPTTEDEIEEQRRFSEWMQHEAEQRMLEAEEFCNTIKD